MAGEDRARLLWTKGQPCMAPGAPDGCNPPRGRWTEANHGTGVKERGMGQKAHDDTAVPLCTFHHRCWGHNSGPFKGWDQAQRRAFEDEAIAATRTRWEGRRPLPDWA